MNNLTEWKIEQDYRFHLICFISSIYKALLNDFIAQSAQQS